MSELFISHSSADGAISVKLWRRLKEQKHESVFLDFDPEKGIVAGQSWEQTLYHRLRDCRAVLAVCTNNYLGSHWCFAEIALARMEGKQIFALLADPDLDPKSLPSILLERQYIDLCQDEEKGFSQLWRAFREHGIAASLDSSWDRTQSPYPGLLAFEEKDAAVFFGRDDEIADGIELLNSVRRQGFPPLVMTLGASGSGKSSLVRAGLFRAVGRIPG